MSNTLPSVWTPPDFPAVRVIVGQGDLDESRVQEITRTVEELSALSDIRFFILDFQQLTFINSKGLGYLILLHNHLSAQNQQLVLAGQNDFLKDLVNVVGVVKLIPYFSTVEEVLQKIRLGQPLMEEDAAA